MGFRSEELMVFNKFEAGSIHKDEFFAFWKEELKASDWVLLTLQQGYLIPFKENPSIYSERNNKTVRDNMKIVRCIVADMISKGIVKVVKEKPFCVNPLGLVSKPQQDGTLKHRLVLDLSRHVNSFIEEKHVRLSHLERALEITEVGDLQIVYDLTSAYYHIRIEQSQCKFLGACFENSDGSTVYFEYQHLPFGTSSAVHCITKLWKPIISYLNEKGIRNSIYIDDGRILARSPEEAERHAVMVYNTITKAGWAIEESKSDKLAQAATSKTYLGVIIDTQFMVVKMGDEKLRKVEERINQVLQRTKTPVKQLASTLGLIVSMEPSHGMRARISTRSGYAALGQHTDMFGWKGLVDVTEGIKNELRFFKEHMWTKNEGPIKSTLMETRLETIIENPIARKLTLSNHIPGNEVVVSDASDSKVFVYDLQDSGRTILDVRLTEEQRLWGSGVRELLAILWTVKQWETQGVLRKRVYWITDSENVVSFIKKGSRRDHIQKIIFELALLTSSLHICIEPVHLLREDPRIVVADEGSKRRDSDNWSIDAWSFSQIEALTGKQFETDVFADHLNTRVDRFFSLFYNENSSRVDAFSQDWSMAGLMWICPPVSLLIQTHRKIINSRCQGVLVLPMWRSSTFFSFFFKNMSECNYPYIMLWKWKPYIVQNEDARDTALFGSVPFEFAAISFNTC